jgi:hypothetical protein
MAETTDADGTSTVTAPEGTSPEKPSRVGRRQMILGVAAAGVGASVVAGAEPAGAEVPEVAQDVLLSTANTATATTSISMAVNGDSGLKGIDTSSAGGYGLYGTSKKGTGVYGTITGDTRGHNAVEGVDASTGEGGGAGVYGSSTHGTGVYGISKNATGVYGIHSTGAGSGVAGLDDSDEASSNGVYGSSDSGNGVYGVTDSGNGVYGNATGDSGAGVNGTGAVGVNGSSSVAGGAGVSGNASGNDSYAVEGNATGPGDSFGLIASSENSFALYVDGTSNFTGAMSKPGGSFKIDHPLDADSKYLYHSFVESPDMKNVYDGTVTLDGKGEATVELPDWFEALNRDYRYQLTAIGSSAPELHISREVQDGTFSVAGGKPEQRVSWQVTGIRQDAWANANRIPVEVDKKAEDRGRYLHPELFGGEAITELAKARERRRRTKHATGLRRSQP